MTASLSQSLYCLTLWHLLRKVKNHFFFLFLYNSMKFHWASTLGQALHYTGDWKVKKDLVLILGSILITALFHCCLALLLYGNLTASVSIVIWGHLKEPTWQRNSEFYTQLSIEEMGFEDACERGIDLNKGNRTCSYKKIFLLPTTMCLYLVRLLGFDNVLT